MWPACYFAHPQSREGEPGHRSSRVLNSHLFCRYWEAMGYSPERKRERDRLVFSCYGDIGCSVTLWLLDSLPFFPEAPQIPPCLDVDFQCPQSPADGTLL
jgi:hypothetical protein